ncbi:CcdB family protein [Pluralibacter gergoviae]|nr:CcdB family protein [Pluralibacter gergoviae]EKW6619608.1 hypothetical protein [Pluralibacter gergoviae]
MMKNQRYAISTPAITFLDARKIAPGDFICSVESHRSDIIAALDAIITNT